MKSAFWNRLTRSIAPLDSTALFDAATRRSRLYDLGDPPHEEALRIIVEACNGEAALSLFGQVSARQHLIDLLETRLRLVNYWREKTEIQKQSILPPLFITGLPRSGSTFLHDILGHDAANRVPMTWEVMFPLPPPTKEGFGGDPRIARADSRLRLLRWIKPSIMKAHPIGAALPQECIAIMSYSLLSDEFLCMFRIPSYERWLRTQDMTASYMFHRRFLAHLQWLCPGERWVLKAPDHVHALEALIRVYPDARFVFLHRDPLKVLGSVASLSRILLSAFSNRIDPRQIGSEEARILREKATNIIEFQDRHPELRERFINIRYSDMVRDPLENVRRIYGHFGLVLTGQTEAQISAFLKDDRGKKRKMHGYRLADFGLDPVKEGTRFADYRARFAIPHEPL